MKKVLFGIITFRERYEDAPSFRSLVASYQQQKNSDELHVFVYDNTDISQWKVTPIDQTNGVAVHYEHNPRNGGISAAVNRIAQYAEQNGYQWLILLDQDTLLPLSFYDIYISFAASNAEDRIALPKVMAGQRLISPCYYRAYRASNWQASATQKRVKLQNISAINSGLMINVDLFWKLGGYNPNIRLDFCDHDFMERLNGRGLSATLLNITLHQDFSAQTHDQQKSLTRYAGFLHDLQAYSIGRKKWLLALRVDLPHLLKQTIKHKSIEFIKLWWQHKQRKQ